VAAQSALKEYPRLVNAMLVGVHRLERRCLFPFNDVAGLSAMCLAQR
jgi:hypothetical protein